MDSALRSLCSYFAARCIGHGNVIPQTLAGDIIIMCAPLILNTFKCKHHRQNVVKVKEDGVMDTLRVLLHGRDYELMHSRSSALVTLLYWF